MTIWGPPTKRWARSGANARVRSQIHSVKVSLEDCRVKKKRMCVVGSIGGVVDDAFCQHVTESVRSHCSIMSVTVGKTWL